MPCPAVQVEALRRGLHCRGLGAFICNEAGNAKPAGVGPPPLGGLAGKPPDAGMTGLPEGCPSGGGWGGEASRPFSLFSAPQWHLGLSYAPSLLSVFPSELSPLTLLQLPWPFSQCFHIPSSVNPASIPLHFLFSPLNLVCFSVLLQSELILFIYVSPHLVPVSTARARTMSVL